MTKSLDEIRKKLKELDKKSAGKNSSSFSDKLTYRHWDIPEGTSTILRFLPDGNDDNVFFWVEKAMITLPFAGVMGGDEHKEVTITVPCMHMWNETCPILVETAPWWKDDSLVELARKYYKRRTYLIQGFVKSNILNEVDLPENPIRRLILSPQIFPTIKNSLLDPDMENSPVDYVNGTDFVISKTTKGAYADYSTSKWARKESSLTDEQLSAIEQYGLYNLNDWLPKKPTSEGVNAIFEMFQASLDGNLYDPERWGKFYKPYGLEIEGVGDSNSSFESTPKSTAKPVSAPAVAEMSLPVSTVEDKPLDVSPPQSDDTPRKKSPKEVLEMVKNRTTH